MEKSLKCQILKKKKKEKKVVTKWVPNFAAFPAFLSHHNFVRTGALPVKFSNL